MNRTRSVIEKSFSINLKIMRMLCLYAPKRSNRIYKIKAYLMYCLFVIPIVTLGILYLLLEENLNMERVNYNAGFLAQITGCTTKFLPFVTNARQIRKCIDYFDSSFYASGNAKQEKIMKKCILVCRRNTFIFLVCVSGGVVSWVTKPFFWESRALPVDIWLPFNPYENVIVYALVYVYLAFGAYYNSLATAVIDPLIAGLAYHATCQIKILKDNLEHLSEYSDIELKQASYLKPSRKTRIMYKKIQHSIVHHSEILQFVKEYEGSFSLVVFSQFTVSVFVICFSCLQLSEIESFGYYFLQLLTYFSVILSQIYFYCFYGSTLFEESANITNAVYMGTWYDYDETSKKALITLMERTKKPVVITAGKILDLSLDTFTIILKRSYSLVAVLKNYQ